MLPAYARLRVVAGAMVKESGARFSSTWCNERCPCVGVMIVLVSMVVVVVGWVGRAVRSSEREVGV